MSFNQPKYSKKEVSQKFNLKELLGYEPSDEQKRAFYELAVNKMADRTLGGEDINGKEFKPYSEEYAKTKGVSRDSVDMVLTGDMITSFEQSLERKNLIKIKVGEGENTLKAYNHNVGDTLPKRTFFGFKSKKDLEDVISEVDQLKSRRQQQQEEARETIDLAAIRNALRLINIETEGFDGEG